MVIISKRFEFIWGRRCSGRGGSEASGRAAGQAARRRRGCGPFGRGGGSGLPAFGSLKVAKAHRAFSLRSQPASSSLLPWPKSLLWVSMGTGPGVALLTSPLFGCGSAAAGSCAATGKLGRSPWGQRDPQAPGASSVSSRERAEILAEGLAVARPPVLFSFPWERRGWTEAL